MKYKNIIFVILISISAFGFNFIYDSPAILKRQLLMVTDKQDQEYIFSMLYSSYSLPNIFMPMFLGFLTDYYGDRIVYFSLLLFIAMGQYFFSYGIQKTFIWMMIGGKFLQGLGGESLNIVIQKFLIRWFKNSNLSLNQGTVISITRIANILCVLYMPILSNIYGLSGSQYFGFLICSISFIAGIFLIYMDMQLDQKDSIIIEQPNYNIIQIWKQQKNLFKLIIYLMTLVYISISLFFIDVSVLIVENHLDKSNSDYQNDQIAGRIMAIPSLVQIFFSILIGYFIDKYGQRLNLITISFSAIIFTFFFFIFLDPFLSMSIFGIGITIFNQSVWTSIPYLVQEKNLGVLLGIQSCMYNLLYFISPMAISGMKTYYQQKINILDILQVISLLCIMVMIKIYNYDQKNQISLNEKESQKLVDQMEDVKFDIQEKQQLIE